jgi:hypothetical protein
VASTVVIERGTNMRVKKRSVAPGEVELGIVAVLQFVVTAALVAAPPQWLAGNGTALLTLSSYPHLTAIAKGVWSIVFFAAGGLCVQAVRLKNVVSRKWAWQVVIPLWACWMTGLSYPLIVGLPTNVITLSAVAVLVIQWLVTRLLVPLDSSWYSREVPMEQHQGERRLSVDDPDGSGHDQY